MTFWDCATFIIAVLGVYVLALLISGKRTNLNQHTNKSDYNQYNEDVDDNNLYLDDYN